MAGKKLTDVVSVDNLAKDFKVDTVSDFDEQVSESGETYGYAYKHAVGEGMSEEQAEEAALKAEGEERDEAVGKYMDAIMAVADQLYGEHGLVLSPKHKGKGRSFEYKVAPEKSWRTRPTASGRPSTASACSSSSTFASS